MRHRIFIAGLIATLALDGSAFAQHRRRHPSPAAPAAPATPPAGGDASGAPGASGEPAATLRTEGGRRVYVSSATIEVRGEIQRPYAFSLSGRSSLGYSYVDVPVHFLQEIINAVRHTPF